MAGLVRTKEEHDDNERLLYIALWTEADREGRMRWSPGNFKLRFLPGDNCDINELCHELLEDGLVVTYVVDGKTYAEIPTFTLHQMINNRERASILPTRMPNTSPTPIRVVLSTEHWAALKRTETLLAFRCV